MLPAVDLVADSAKTKVGNANATQVINMAFAPMPFKTLTPVAVPNPVPGVLANS